MTISNWGICRFCLVFLAVGILRASPSEAASTVAITKPSAGTVYKAAQTVGLTAGVSAGVTKVEFLNGAKVKCTDPNGSNNFTCGWRIGIAENGTHSWTAKAYDASGLVATSSPVNLTVNIASPSEAAPTVAITKPSAGTSYRSAQTVGLVAGVSAGVTKVEFLNGAKVKCTDPNGSNNFTCGWRIGIAENGTHSWTAKAYDASGLVATSSPVNLTVNISPNQPPTADAGSDQMSQVGTTLTLDGSKSFDPDGSITSYAWNFGDENSASGASMTHSYADAATYSARLTVTDNAGAQSTDTAVVTVTSAPPPEQEGVGVSPGQDLQAAINAKPAGTTFLIKAGVHRLSNYVTPKNNDQFIGEPGAILNGSQRITDFVKSDSAWMSSGMTMENPVVKGPCQNGTACQYTNDVYYDNRPLRRVMSRAGVVPGTFYFDYAGNRIYIGDTPVGHTVEVGVATRAFKGTETSARGVTIRGLIIEKFANEATVGAIDGKASWTVEDCEVRFTHAAGVRAQFIRNNYIHHNGQYGIVYSDVNAIIEGNEIAFNNYLKFANGYAGGTKFTNTTNLVIRNNDAHHNDGPGLWTDGANINVLYEDNLVENNALSGIFHEIGYDAIIRNNIARNNNTARIGKSLWWGANIYLNTSQNVEIYGNTVEGGNGIGITDTGSHKGNATYGPLLARNNYIHDNVIKLTTGSQSGVMGIAANAGKNNRFVNNTYYLANLNAKHFQWESDQTKEGWRGLGQDVNGTFIR